MRWKWVWEIKKLATQRKASNPFFWIFFPENLTMKKEFPQPNSDLSIKLGTTTKISKSWDGILNPPKTFSTVGINNKKNCILYRNSQNHLGCPNHGSPHHATLWPSNVHLTWRAFWLPLVSLKKILLFGRHRIWYTISVQITKAKIAKFFLKNNPKEQGAKVSRMEADIYPWGLLGIQIMSVGIVRNNILIHVD